MKRSLLSIFLATTLLIAPSYSREHLSQLFSDNQAIIYTINIRNFGAIDKDQDGIIDPEKGDVRGTFVNAQKKLPELQKEGINTVYLLPITKVGKLKALGTAGSLYALDSFNEIAPELDDLNNEKTALEEAKDFVKYAHDLNINVILDLPSCGSYDLSLNKPDWFIQEKDDLKNEAKIPADWTDVRLFKVFDDEQKEILNKETLENFKSFVDLAQNIGFDGIRADVAAIKPYVFWKNLIDYAKKKNPNFVFIAEASPAWDNPAPNGVSHYASIDELLNAGFDGYYGSFSDFKNLKTKKEFDKNANTNRKILQKHKNKAIMITLATHDQQAPILRGKNYWNTVLWLSCTLPLNTYFLDGFKVGDDFTYEYENKPAPKTSTDDEFYFVHSGMFDIFNFTGPIRPKHPELKSQYLKAIQFKKSNLDLYKFGKFELLKTNNEKIYGYTLTVNKKQLAVVGSLEEKEDLQATIKPSYLKKDLKKGHKISIINATGSFENTKNAIKTTLKPLEIKVYLITLN